MGRNTDTRAASAKQKEMKLHRVTSYNAKPKLCLTCNTPLPYKEHKTRKFCSRSCSAKFNNQERVRLKKRCISCDSLIPDKRTYCSHKCAHDFRRARKIAQWMSGEISGSGKDGIILSVIRNYVLSKQGECEVCGWSEVHPVTGNVVLQVHHIDGDYSNNRPRNLQVLCPNHHALTESFGSLNKGNGRPYRWLLKPSRQR